MISKSQFNITVAAAPCRDDVSLKVDVDHLLRFAKVSYLYADHTTLISPLAQPLLTPNAIQNFTRQEWIQYFRVHVDAGSYNGKAKDFFELLIEVDKRTRLDTLSAKQREAARSCMEDCFNDDWFSDLKLQFAESLKECNVDQLQKLVDTSNVSIRLIGKQYSNTELINSFSQTKGHALENVNLAEEYLDELINAVEDPNSYPFTDVESGDLLKILLESGIYTIDEVKKNRSKPVGLALGVIERLPIFEKSTVDDIIDIRKELHVPLIKFRSAIFEYSKEMESAAWDESFAIEADMIFREKIEPAVAEIEDSCNSNKYLLELANQVISAPAGNTFIGSLAASWVPLHNFPEIAVAIAGTATLGATLIKAKSIWQQKAKELEDHQLFFYYKTNKLLDDRH